MLKEKVHDFWNQQSCDTQAAQSEKFSKTYYEEIEQFRYYDQPFIHSFAQFTRYSGKKVLEVGFGAGTDFIQWLRAGARVSGIDLTEEALQNTMRRISAYDLPRPERLELSDAENLPFPDNSFDLGYSFGVLHHTPDTGKALRELVRVVSPGGELKVMLYNRHSVWALQLWVKHALLRGRPWRSFRWALANYMESAGTKGFTRKDLLDLFSSLPVHELRIRTEVTSADSLASSGFPPLNWIYRILLYLAGERRRWDPLKYAERFNTPTPRLVKAGRGVEPTPALFTGNRLGLYHCITARKDAG